MTESVLEKQRIVILGAVASSLYLYSTETTELVTVGGFTLHCVDVVVAAAVFVALKGVLRRAVSSPLELALLLFCGLLVLSFARGVALTSPATAGVPFRDFAGFVALVAFIHFRGPRLDRAWLFDKLVLLGWGITLLAVARLVFGRNLFLLQELPPGAEPRILDAAGALMLGQAAFIAWHDAVSLPSGAARRWRRAAFLAFATIVFISDQRTATFATLGGVAAIIASMPRQRRRSMMLLGGLACTVGAGLIAVACLSIAGDLATYIPRPIQMIVDQQSTFGWRIEQWTRYFDTYLAAPLIDQALGQPFGILRAAASRFIGIDQDEANFLLYTAHNAYVQVLLSTGALGLFLFVAVFVVGLAKGSRHLRKHHDPELRLAIAILISQAVFAVSYSLLNEQGLLMAMATQIIVMRRSPSGLEWACEGTTVREVYSPRITVGPARQRATIFQVQEDTHS